MRYLISYDLNKPGQNYDPLYAALAASGAKRILLSQWVLSTTSSSVDVRDHFKRFVDANDRLLVCELVHNWASYNGMVDINKI